MLSFEGFVHREELAGLIQRWMVNRPLPDDVIRLKTIVNFNLYIARIWVNHLASRLLRDLHGTQPTYHHVMHKGELKDFMVANLDYTNARIEEMTTHYRRFPEDYYREAPFDGGYYTVSDHGADRLAAVARIKRFRRIAEKGSRRIIKFLFKRIRDNAEALARERADALGVPQSELLTSPEQMEDEFLHAERRVIKSIKVGTIEDELPLISIPDVVGMKIIDEDPEFARLRQALGSEGDIEVIEEEKHTGDYKATNLRICWRLPMDMLHRTPPAGRFLKLLAFRGLHPDQVPVQYEHFLHTAEKTVKAEIIVSNFQEFLESEIGCSMHEEHILKQRSNPDYTGHLATNVRYLMDYTLALCRSPAVMELEEIPIKLWVRYMPDTMAQLARRLYLNDDLFFDTMS